MMKKLWIVAIALLPFVMAHAETAPASDAEKMVAQEITAPQTEKAKEDNVTEKPKAAKANTPKKQKMGKAGGKGG
ncbi:MAG: hypothetical protein Q8N30_09115 [Methylococcales bacterium]|nr:hypothetical protein [Methylococcales bacterium]